MKGAPARLHPLHSFIIFLPAQNYPLHELSSFIFFLFPMGILVILYIRMGLRIRQTSEIQRNLPRMQQQHHNGPTMPQTGLVQQVLYPQIGLVL